jgi:hypothetical protein
MEKQLNEIWAWPSATVNVISSTRKDKLLFHNSLLIYN